MADNRKLAAGILNLPASARQELAQRAQDMEREGVVGMLRKAGKEMYDNPIVNTAIGFTPVLGDVQAAGETMAALNRGAPWQETAGYAAGMLPFVPMIGKTVWHGSPHTFDKFDLSKIGTGEGAQSYGHGLYLAEARPTAENYRQSLTMDERIGGFKPGKAMVDNIPAKDISQDVWEVADQMASRNMNVDEYINHLKNKIASSGENVNRGSVFNELLEQANKVKPELTGKNVRWEEPGSLYKVDLPDEQIAKMLDWDKPLSEQPEIQQAFVNHLVENQRLSPERASDFLKDKTAGEAYGTLSGRNNQEIISQSLLERGIPGIQYLDQASRGAGEGTRNYVVFSDEIPQILERNGQPVAQALRNYGLEHRPMTIEGGASQLHELTRSFGEDVYGKQAMQFFGSGDPREKKALEIMKSVRGNPDAPVTIYRGVPEGVNQINQGDWVTIVPEVAADYGNVISQQVPASHITSWPDSLMEFGYYPPKAK